ncbi:MAG: hypothetical protein EBZ78_01455 [Verrucomicrobia bacterium]|nr:hypothetical protein [Verrucomicrobiota bacterium]
MKELVCPPFAVRPGWFPGSNLSTNRRIRPSPVAALLKRNSSTRVPSYRSGKIAKGAFVMTRSYPPPLRGTNPIWDLIGRSRQTCRSRVNNPLTSRFRRLYFAASSAPTTETCTN